MHVIRETRCISCGVCGKSCPIGAILDDKGNPTKRIPPALWAKPVIDSHQCSACSLCVEICLRDCIAITHPTFKGDIRVFAALENEKDCVGCGRCETICPLCAITMKEVG